MPAGPVDRTLLQSFYQDPGQAYDDKKTEGAFGVLADTIDATSNQVESYYSARGYIINCGTFTAPTSGILLDGGFF